ncbi:MAG TPA: porin [Gemmataceae bacterium]|nr:porin [Gemmataceae bacterium]
MRLRLRIALVFLLPLFLRAWVSSAALADESPPSLPLPAQTPPPTAACDPPAAEPKASAKGPGAGEIGEPGEAKGSSGEEPAATGSGNSLQPRFNMSEGFVAETPDGAFRYHIGGRFDWDSGWYRAPQNIQQSLDNPLLDGTDLRRFRLAVDGTVWQNVDFKLEADFSKASDFKDFQATPQTNIFITDAWIALRDLPVLDTVKLGHQKEYLTFSNGTSANSLPFMERPYIYDAFQNNFSWDSGVSTSRTYFDKHMTSWVGFFWNGTQSEAFNAGGHYALSGRLTVLPVYDEDRHLWVNLGVAGSVRSFGPNDPNDVTVRPLVRTGESFNVPDLIDTGTLLSHDGLQILGADVQSAWGPLTVGGEFLCWFINNAYTGNLPNPNGILPPGAESVGNLFFSGFSVEALYFLTPGDHRDIDRVTPGYARVRPVRNFLCLRHGDGPCCKGLGAWEVGVRYDHVDVNSGLIQAGRLDSVTCGVNWYLNPNTRITANYVYTNRDTGNPSSSGNFDAFGVRVHFDF